MQADPITHEADWQTLTDRAHAPLAQRWLYGAAAQAVGREARRVLVMDGDRPVAVAQSVCRKLGGVSVGLVTQGPLFIAPCDPRRALKTLRRALPRLTVMTPSSHLRRLSLSAATPTLVLDLTHDEDHLRAGLNGKWRNALKNAEKARLKVAQITATQAALTPLLHSEKQRQSQGHYRALPPEFTLALLHVAPHAFRLFEASDAQMLFLRHGNSATYQMGNAGPEGRAVNAHNLILWEAMMRLKAEGVERLDLGTFDAVKAPDLARFKMRTGGAQVVWAPAQLL
ncbi:GNAT family N-acetyltransferase [Celeribacter sp.]|uniref:GNAT family N-acetyltransferase n=1 Tax=Celeribacter sp. TaxID=1890673 RepID=UPI003A93DF89